jgi:hypothetical protein
VYARNYLPALLEEVKAARQPSLCCPRCCGKFHDEDIEQRPDEFYACPNCGSVEHEKCRGPLAGDVFGKILAAARSAANDLDMECGASPIVARAWKTLRDVLAEVEPT